MRVLLSGYYGFDNLGDEAILAGLGGALRERGHVPVVLSRDPAATTRRHSFEARHRTKGVLGALSTVDAVVSGGGGLLQDKTSSRSLSYYLWVLRLARWFGRPVAVYGQSLGPLSQAGRAKLARRLRGVPLFLRDRPSLELAADMGLSSELVGDAALLLAERGSPPVAPGVEPAGTRTVVASGLAPGVASGSTRVVDPSASAAPIILVPRGGYDAYNAVLERLATSLTTAGREVAVLPLHPVEDSVPARRLIAAVPGGTLLEATSVQGAVALLAGAAYVVSARLHGSILAAVAGVGFAGLSYDPKVAGFLEQVAAPVFEVPVDEPALLRAALHATSADSVAIAALIESAHAGVDALLEALR